MQSGKDTDRREPPEAPRPDEGEAHPEGRDAPRREIGGTDGPEPTRYGDWEHNGRCTDF